MRQPWISIPKIAPSIEEQKDPSEKSDCGNSKNQYPVLKSNPSLGSRSCGILIAHRATLRSGSREGNSETASRNRQVQRDASETSRHFKAAAGA